MANLNTPPAGADLLRLRTDDLAIAEHADGRQRYCVVRTALAGLVEVGTGADLEHFCASDGRSVTWPQSGWRLRPAERWEREWRSLARLEMAKEERRQTALTMIHRAETAIVQHPLLPPASLVVRDRRVRLAARLAALTDAQWLSLPAERLERVAAWVAEVAGLA